MSSGKYDINYDEAGRELERNPVYDTAGNAYVTRGGSVTRRRPGAAQSVRFHEPVQVADYDVSSFPEEESDRDEQVVEIVTNPVGVYGWKKYCLYVTILIFTCLAIINIGLVVYVMRIMDINRHGAGALHFHEDSLRVEGRAEFTRGLYADHVSSFDNKPLILTSNSAVHLQTNSSSLHIGQGKAVADSPTVTLGFENRTYFSASSEEMVIGANETKVVTELGLEVRGGLITSAVNGVMGKDLLIESESKGVTLKGADTVAIESTDGAVDINSLRGVNIKTDGNIILSGQGIVLSGLKEATTQASHYTLCICPSGRLFKVPGDSLCSAFGSAVCN